MEYTLVIKGYVNGEGSDAAQVASIIGELALMNGADCWSLLSIGGDLLWESHQLVNSSTYQPLGA